MNRFLTILTLILTTACNGPDYSVKDSLTQTVNRGNSKYLIIECYCHKGVEINDSQTDKIQIDVTGKLENVGYHGDQEKPKEIGVQTLSFKTEIKNDTLRLVSKEWTFMHHSYLIDELKIQIPKGLKYEIAKIEGNDLEGREIK